MPHKIKPCTNLEISNLLLSNARDSLRIGIEDFENIGKDKARFGSAVRNVMAGILLLIKERLLNLSRRQIGDILLYEKFRPQKTLNGKMVLEGFGNTVRINTLEERCRALNIDVKWNLLKKISSLRNDIEHRYTELSVDKGKELFTDAFMVLDDLIKKEFSVSAEKLLGKDSWQTLLKVEKLYHKKIKECQSSWETNGWKDIYQEFGESLSCPKCESEFLKPIKEFDATHRDRNSFLCLSCNKKTCWSEFAERVVRLRYDGEENIGPCENCEKYTIVSVRKECLNCGSDVISRRHCEIHQCDFMPDENECGDCLSIENGRTEDD
jgi:hypothetical protein